MLAPSEELVETADKGNGSFAAVTEINTLPAMTSTSALPASANAAGISFEELVIRMISYGLQNTAY